MGDSPSVVYVLQDRRDDPSQAGWGGRFVRIWDERKVVFDRHTTASAASSLRYRRRLSRRGV